MKTFTLITNAKICKWKGRSIGIAFYFQKSQEKMPVSVSRPDITKCTYPVFWFLSPGPILPSKSVF